MGLTAAQKEKIVKLGQLEKFNSHLIGNLINKTYSELKALRDNSQLKPGQWYRITDYTTTTVQTNTQSAGHQFDVIVRADDVNVINENAYAALHSGDTYFSTAGAKLEAWRLLYCLDNIAWSLKPSATCTFQKTGGSPHDNIGYVGTEERNGTTWHKWDLSQYSMEIYSNYFYTASIASGDAYANSMGQWKKVGTVSNVVTSDAQGKGTITWMKDEFGNECPYDFKNIQFKVGAKENAGTVANVFYYTFSVASGTNDATVTDHSLNGFYCYNNKIGKYIINQIQKLNFNVFRSISTTTLCHSNTFGDSCYSNTLGYNCNDNTFGSNCYSNTFGFNCYSNTFRYKCYSNTFGNSCSNNTFGSNCYSNTFGNSCYSNTFGYNCYSNTFGDNCGSNTFGDGCQYIKFGTSSTTKNYCRYIIVENGNQYIYLNCSATTSSSSYFQNVKIAQGVNNTSSYKTITHTTAGDTFQTVYKPINTKEISV